MGPVPSQHAARLEAMERRAHAIAEAQAIRLALERSNGNRQAAARALGIHKTTLFRKIKALGLEGI